MPTKNLIEHDPPKFLSMKEARLAGAAANRLSGLRNTLSKDITGGSLHMSTERGSMMVHLNSVDTEALMAFLIERDELFLNGLNVETTE